MTPKAGGQHAPAPQLTGTGRLADDLWLIAHHERTGRLLLSPRAAGLGLAGALLAELMLAGAIQITAGVVAVAGPAPPGEALAAGVLGQVTAEQRHPAQEWLVFLARTAPAAVAGRLEQAGYLTPAPGWPPWRSQRPVPVDADCAFAPVTRICSALGPSHPAAVQGAALAGLAAACGLGARLALYLPPGSRRRLEEAVGWLDPGLREVIAQTQAAVDSALLAHRK
jgi:Golgi phosphoprotein 3 (GPP34)